MLKRRQTIKKKKFVCMCFKAPTEIKKTPQKNILTKIYINVCIYEIKHSTYCTYSLK